MLYFKEYMQDYFKDRYLKLNKQQKEAVDNIFGPMLVIAGPGTGKTELLALRVANILKITDAEPESILCLTFTESGKVAMRKRLNTLIGSRADNVSIFTFHSFCGYLKNKYGEHFWKGNSYEVAGELTEYNILENIFQNLSHDDVLKKFHHEDGHIFLKDVKVRIKDLKEAGITPEEFFEIIKDVEKKYKKLNNKLNNFINEKIGEKIKIKYENFLVECEEFIFPELKITLEEALDSHNLSEWKKKNTEEIDGEKYLKGTKNIEKMYSLQNIYQKYEEEKQKEKVIDYADIILNTLLELKRNETLRVEIQEFFQFILVDEFQDTNNAQFEILKILTSHEINYENPNIMVVGDDDQAVYRFQGGDINNILEFKNIFKNAKVINLEENYRSTQKILNLSNNVIKNNKNRFDKKLKANKEKEVEEKYTPIILQFEDEEKEVSFIISDIKKKIENGVPPHEIAVIAKKHKQLEKIAITLNNENIKYSYEKENSLLDNPKINEIITILKCVNSLFVSKSNIENYIPQILTFPFFQIPKIEIIRLAIKIKKEKKLWFEEIINSEIENIKKVGKFLSDIIALSVHTPLYHLIDKIILDSGFKDYYFKENKGSDYVNFLEDLKSLYEVIKNYKKQNILYAKDLEFILDNIQKYELNINQKNELTIDGHITLLTSHKSKGLEYEVVYVLGLNKKNWATKGKSSLLNFTMGMNYTRYKEEENDFIRSVYVATTRAKNNLIITHTDNLVHFLEGEYKKEVVEQNINNFEGKFSLENFPPLKSLNFSELFLPINLNKDEKDVFKNILENYKISPTHLNNFLDFVNAGPNQFIHDNLLHFPSPPNDNSLFGTLMHNVLEYAGNYKLSNNKDITLKKIQNYFKDILEKEILNKNDYNRFINWGFDTIEKYYSEIKKFAEGGTVERFEISFAYDNIILNDAKLTGNIDRIQINKKENEIIIFDYKTGKKTTDSWEAKDDNEKIKLYKYKKQLLFYKLLLENSKEFKNYKIKTAVLDFIEINKKHNMLYLNYNQELEEIDKLKKLIVIIYNKIINLDFPDISKYSPNLKGILEFENDLLNGLI